MSWGRQDSPSLDNLKAVFVYHNIAFFDKQDTCDHRMSGSGGCPLEWAAYGVTTIQPMFMYKTRKWGKKISDKK